jgi:hypothetical protein
MFSFGDVRAVGNLPECTNALGADSRDPKMTRLLARIRILPADAESNLDVVIQTLKNKVPKDMELKSHKRTNSLWPECYHRRFSPRRRRR